MKSIQEILENATIPNLPRGGIGPSNNPNPLTPQQIKQYALGPAGVYNSLFQNKIPQGLLHDNQYRNIPLTQGQKEEQAAEDQSQWWKAALTVPRTASKVGEEVLKFPGVIGGMVMGSVGNLMDLKSGKDEHDFVSLAFDNAWINAIEDAGEWHRDTLLPVHVSAAVENGTFTDKVGTADFWATEGADGLGYMLSMLVPGMVLSKIGAGARVFNAVGKMKKMSETAAKTARTLAKAGMPTNAKAAEIMLQGGFNTYFEAGAEAKGAMDSYKQSPEYQKLLDTLPDLEKKYVQTQIEGGRQYTPSEMLEIQNTAKQQAQKEIDDKVSALGAKVFTSNVGILLIPNMIMAKILWGGKASGGKALNRAMAKEGAESFKGLSIAGKAGVVGNITKDTALAAAREGAWEEGMQSATEQYFTKDIDNTLSNFISKDVLKSYSDMWGTTSGQTAMFLGAVYGGGMSGFMGSKNRMQEDKQIRDIMPLAIKNIRSSFTILENDIYEEVDGKPVFVENKDGDLERKKDAFKLLAREYGIKDVNNLAAQYSVALENNDVDAIEGIKNLVFTDFIRPFIINETLGIPALKKAILESGVADEAVAEEGITIEEFIKPIVKKAISLQDKYRRFTDFFDVLNVKNKEATPLEMKQFTMRTGMSYVDTHSELEYLDDSLDKINESFQSIKGEVKVREQEVNEAGDEARRIEDERRTVREEAQKAEKGSSTRTELFKNSTQLGRNARTARKIEKGLQEINDKPDVRIDNLKERKEKLLTRREEVAKELDKFWDGKSINKNLDKKIKKIRKEQKDVVENQKALGELLNTISTATEEELDNIKFLDSELSIAPTKAAIQLRRAELKKEKAEKIEEAKKQSKEKEEQLEEEEANEEEIATFLKNSFNVGEDVVIPESYNGKQAGEIGTIISKTAKSITIKLRSGDTVTLRNKTVYNNRSNMAANFSVEGSLETNDKVEVAKYATREDDNILEEANDSQLVSKDESKGYSKFGYISQEAVDWEESPINKVGQKKAVVLNDKETEDSKLTENNKKAIEYFKNKDKSQIDFIVKYLPLSVMVTDEASLPLRTFSDNVPKSSYNKNEPNYNDIWGKTSKWLRSSIIKEVINNNVDLTEITVEVAGQKGGRLKIAAKKDGKVVENGIQYLDAFKGDIGSIKSTDIYIVNDINELQNIEDPAETIQTKRPLAKGEVYLKIKTANGRSFPLKLNIRKIKESEAELLYELYTHRLKDVGEGKAISIKNTTPELLEKVKSLFFAQLELFDKKAEDVTIKEITDFLIWDGTKVKKSQVRIYDKKLKVGAKTFTAKTFATAEGKASFIKTITEDKRHHIRFKRRKNQNIKDLTLEDRKYVEYLIREKVLSTNAVINEPTFQGATDVYIDSKKVRVNGKLSLYNGDMPRTYSKLLIGTESMLKRLFPRLFKNIFNLNNLKTKYIGPKGQEANRMTSLLNSKPDMSKPYAKNAATRGVVIDALTRYFFAGNINLNAFVKKGKALNNKYNKEGNSNTMLQDSLYTELYSILEEYRREFDRLGLTIYSTSPIIDGKLGKRGLIAGELDFLAYNNKTKKWIIIDIKTSSQDRGKHYNGKIKDVNKYNYKSKDRIQQNGYRELLFQKSGIQVSELWILPLTTKGDNSTNSSYSKVEKSSEGMFLKVDMSKTIYQLLNIEAPSEGKNSYKNNEDLPIILPNEDEPFDEGTPSDMGDAFHAMIGFPKDEEMDEAPTLPEGYLASQRGEGGGKKGTKKAANKLLTDEEVEQAIKDVKSLNYTETSLSSNGKFTDVIITNGNYVFMFKQSRKFITDIDLIFKILSEHNEIVKNPRNKYDIDSIMNMWFKREIIAKSNQNINKGEEKVKKVAAAKEDTLDLKNKTEEELETILNTLVNSIMEKGLTNVKFTKIMDKVADSSNRIKIETLIEYMVSQGVAYTEIEKDCINI